ncbi:MAG TPA: glucose-6-phosphate isomerase [Planctomycetota bacterium]|nr:glucose-6-phosphate isomerase [Planctomycetota bacterium]HRR82413.1 glucose-6-phosphate isomerase [Planctomycetota bacterium]HRT96117.1 glucose-6-phosphate isomerase [Planctomycetota bacterium]
MDEKLARMRPDKAPAWRTLVKLARRPFDLAASDALSPRRINTMKSEAAGLRLLYATERVTPDVLQALQELASQTQAVGQFARMMRGEVMNEIVGHPSERRQVLHTASRNVFDDLPCKHDAAQAEATGKARAQLARLKDFLSEVEREGRFTDLVQVGIGGSDLGPRALYIALKAFWKKGRRVHFVSNVDPDDTAAVLDGLDLSRTLVCVVSKSGTTLETLTNERLVAARFERAGLKPKDHFVAVTAEGSPMDDPAKYLRSFHMYDYIGGRYSATSMVGGVALGFGLGYDSFLEILRGAREMDLNALNPNARKNLPLLAALLGIWNRNFLGYETLAILPYSQVLSRFVAHIQQLDMESNGKRVDRCGRPVPYATGPIVWGEPGTNGQHAFYQLIHQSETIVPCEFIGFRQSQLGEDLEVEGTTSQQKLVANLLAQSVALATGKRDDNPNKVFPGNRPSSLLIADRLAPRTLGALLAYYENKVAFQGFIWNINSFDQEGVQLGKLLANKFLAHFKGAPNALGPGERALLKAAGLA